MSALPKAVREQIKLGEDILEAVYPTDPPADPPVEDPPVEDPPVEDPPAEDPPAVPPVEDPPADPPVEDPPETGEHKYKVLQGKYNAEVPRLQKQLRAQEDVINELRQRTNNTESVLAALQATKEQPPEPPEPTLPIVTEQEVTQFGPDLIDLIGRVAENAVLPKVDTRMNSLDGRFQQVEQSASQAGESVARSNRQKVIVALTEAVPKWETQNEDVEFLTWLNEIEPFSGQPRGKLLTQAFQMHDAPRVIAFFKGFQAENAVVAPSEVTPPEITPPEPQLNLEDIVAPGSPKPGTTSAPNESGKRVWTRKDVKDFYLAKNEFVKKGTPIPDEYKAAERDLIKAQSEGRMR